MSDFDVIGKSTPQLAGMQKAMGRTRFVSDLVLPYMLHGAILKSPYAHARILKLDTSRAKRLPGVRAVITFADTPGIKYGPRSEDWYIFAKDKVLFHGHEVAAVAAVDPETAAEALSLIEVEYEPLPAVIDPREALEEGAPLVIDEKGDNLAFEFKIESGEVDRALDESYFVYEDRYYTNQVYQAYLETMGCVAEMDLGGRFVLHAGTQIPNMMRMTYAKALGVSADQIRVKVPEYGGGFGGKMEHNIHLIAALLAQKAGRPVRLFFNRHEDFIAGNPRVPTHFDIRLGVDKSGRLTAKDVKVVGTAGARLVYGHIILATACYRVDSLYRFPNVRALGLTAYTHTVPTSCYRGFGNSQATFVLESSLDMVAEELGMDPAELRLINDLGPDSTSIHGWKINSNGLADCVKSATDTSDWQRKRNERKPLRGIGLACCNHVSGNRPFAREFDGGAGIVHVGRDGRVTVFHGESDMGQGQNTVFAQIVAERLEVPLDYVSVAMVDTDLSPFGCGSFATRGTLMGGNGVLAAAGDAFDQLAKVAARLLETDPGIIRCRKGKFFPAEAPDRTVDWHVVADEAAISRKGAPVMGQGFYDPPTVLPDPVTKYGNISPAYPFACQIAEVEVDPDTGQVKVVDFIAAHDVGRALNPVALEGQIQGGVAQGMGWALTEDMAYDENGRLLNPDFVDYVVPGPQDVPEIRPILVEPVEKEEPYGAKGIGEPALNPAMAAITNAIYNATGIRIKRLPASPEFILQELRKKQGK